MSLFLGLKMSNDELIQHLDRLDSVYLTDVLMSHDMHITEFYQRVKDWWWEDLVMSAELKTGAQRPTSSLLGCDLVLTARLDGQEFLGCEMLPEGGAVPHSKMIRHMALAIERFQHAQLPTNQLEWFMGK
jgi:hypothetical protein